MERSTGFTANVCKLEVVGWKRFCEPKKMWDEVVENEAWNVFKDPQKCSEFNKEGFFEEDLSEEPHTWERNASYIELSYRELLFLDCKSTYLCKHWYRT